eukprot:4158824-Prorocentrum_lima.AAC.1
MLTRVDVDVGTEKAELIDGVITYAHMVNLYWLGTAQRSSPEGPGSTVLIRLYSLGGTIIARRQKSILGSWLGP